MAVRTAIDRSNGKRPVERRMTGRTVDRPVRNPDRYRTGPDRTGTERPVAGTGSIYATHHKMKRAAIVNADQRILVMLLRVRTLLLDCRTPIDTILQTMSEIY